MEKCTLPHPGKHDDLVTKVWYCRGTFMVVIERRVLSTASLHAEGQALCGISLVTIHSTKPL